MTQHLIPVRDLVLRPEDETSTGDPLVPFDDAALWGEPVILDDARWAELVAATEVGVAAWNRLLAHWHQAEKTRIEVHHGVRGRFDFLATAQLDYRNDASLYGLHAGWYRSQRGWAVIRERSTGWIARLKGVENGRKRGSRGWDAHYAMARIPNPKSWRGLGNKPIDQVLATLQLLDFNIHVMQRLDLDAVRAFKGDRP